MNDDTSSWNRPEDTILRYSIDRNEHRLSIDSHLGYLISFNAGGPIAPLNYLSSTGCAFKWDFPILDFKVLNNRPSALFLTEVLFDIEESRREPFPLLAIKQDNQRYHAGDLLVINEGWCDLAEVTISFHLLPGIVSTSTGEGPYPYTITLPVLEDHAQIDVTQVFREEGVDIDGLILLGEGAWEDKNTFVATKADGSEDRLTEAEFEDRVKKYLGRFHQEVGTLAGEIRFTTADGAGRENRVRFHAHVYLDNLRKKGLPKPPTYTYDTTFETQSMHYQRRVQISHTLQSGEADRFTVKIAVPQSSFHRFHATLRDISGLTLRSLPIEMNCFVPRSRRQRVQSAISRSP